MAGAAQGSILGPDLWNVTYDRLLRIEMPDECKLVGYADDVAALVVARNMESAQLKLNIIMRKVSQSMEDLGLELNVHKTEVVVLLRKRIDKEVNIKIGDEIIISKTSTKYLGIWIDSKTSFFEHIKKTAEKASHVVDALSRLMANTTGPRMYKKKLLMGTVNSILLYGAEIWAEALEKESYRKRMSSAQRRSALRIASSYRTVSEDAIMGISAVIPIELLAKEKRYIYKVRGDVGYKVAATTARALTMQTWEERWAEKVRHKWTGKLIQNITEWANRQHGEINYYLTQFLSGHGYFMAYLQRIGKVDNENCMYCPNEKDDAEHTFFICTKFTAERQILQSEWGTVTPGNITHKMMESKNCWDAVLNYVEELLKKKKPDIDLATGN